MHLYKPHMVQARHPLASSLCGGSAWQATSRLEPSEQVCSMPAFSLVLIQRKLGHVNIQAGRTEANLGALVHCTLASILSAWMFT